MRIGRMLWQATKWLLVCTGVTVAASWMLIVYPVDERAFRAALTQPVMIVRARDGQISPVACNCGATLRPDEISDLVAKTLITTEDKRFHWHPGVDPLSMARAVVSGGDRGGSTLAMQLAKNSLTGATRTRARKYAELFFALRIGLTYSRDDVLRLYLSRVNFGRVQGRPIFGLRDAAQVYFGRAPDQLTTAQTALLIGMIKGPELYHPLRRPDAAIARAQVVLSLMREAGIVGRSEVVDVAAALPRAARRLPARDRYLEDQVLRELRALPQPLPDGLHFALTTIDPIAQAQAQRLLLREAKRALPQNVARAALVSVDGKGRVLAMVGGLNYRASTWNLATQALRQPASTAKLATYLAALENGWQPGDIVQDDRRALSGRFVPRNSDYRYLGPIPLSQCLRESRNVCTMWLAQRVGMGKVSEMAHRIGLTETPRPGFNVVLGAEEATLLNSTAAYAAVAQGGMHHDPFLLRGVLGRNGRLLYRAEPAGAQVLAPDIAATMRTLLRGVATAGGTGERAVFSGGTSYGKTGTSQENRDAWFIGFADHGITTGIWVGPPEGQTMRGVAGGDMPARTFAFFNVNLVERFRGYVEQRPASADSFWRDVNLP